MTATVNARADNPTAGDALRDRVGRRVEYLRLSVTDRCNYRCTYCMPEDGVPHAERQDILSFEEIAALVSALAGLGVRRLRITGGEPTVRRDLPLLVRQLAAIPGIEDIALSTNGHLLEELAGPLRAAGVSRLSVSLDSLDPAKFRHITRRGELERVLAGLEAARRVGFASVKINTVAVKGWNDDEVGALCAYAWERGFVPRFIEQMPMADGALYVPGELLSAAEIRRLVESAFPGRRLWPHGGGRARGAGPARYYALSAEPPVGDGSTPERLVGVIAAMTEHFCDACNRVRLSAKGELYSCLAHDDAVDLWGAFRRGGAAAVEQTLRSALAVKRDGHLFQLSGRGGPRRAMIVLGG